METNSVSSNGLEWQNLALYNGKPIGFSDEFGTSDIFRMQNIPSEPPLIGLGLGGQKEGADCAFLSNTAVTSLPISSTPTKRSRASYQNMQNPCCQVEGCNLDLKSAKDYHRRHRICESHSKSPRVIVAGKERRFCQQCSRFHDLSEFDDKKRSCRRRLSDHNARRRRVQPESSSTGISSSLYDQRQENVLLSGVPISVSNPRWENGNSNSMSRQGFGGANMNFGVPNLQIIPSSGSMHAPHPRLLDQCLHVPNTNPDLLSAPSLLSTNTWSLNEGESSDGLMHGNYTETESHHLSLFQQAGPPLSLPHNQQDYHLFKPPNYDSTAFYSTQRYL